MLTLQEILKASRMLEQTGEPRPGYLHDDVDNFEGQSIEVQSTPVSESNSTSNPSEKKISIKLNYEIDEENGDLRIVQE